MSYPESGREVAVAQNPTLDLLSQSIAQAGGNLPEGAEGMSNWFAANADLFDVLHVDPSRDPAPFLQPGDVVVDGVSISLFQGATTPDERTTIAHFLDLGLVTRSYPTRPHQIFRLKQPKLEA